MNKQQKIIIFSGASLTIILVGAFLIFKNKTQDPIQKQEANNETINKPVEEQDPSAILIQSPINQAVPSVVIPGRMVTSFTETFSGSGWKDKTKTTIRQDTVGSLISPNLKLSLNPITPNIATNTPETETLTYAPEAYNPHKACSKNGCLLVENNMLYKTQDFHSSYDETNKINLPFSVSAVGKTDNFWLLASETENQQAEPGSKMQTQIYLYDGNRFEKLVGPEFYKSNYANEFLMGGNDNEFIAGFYGYGNRLLKFKKTEICDKKKAQIENYQIIEHLTLCYEAEDISHWFSSRIKEFSPISFVKKDTDYIFYSVSQPKVIAIEQNIPIDITSDLELGVDINMLRIKNYEPGMTDWILWTQDNAQKEKEYELKINGFDLNEKLEWTSNTLNKKKFVSSVAITGYKGLGEIEFALSADGGATWQKALPGQLVSFQETNNPDFRWRASLNPDSNNQTPFLNQVSLSYLQ